MPFWTCYVVSKALIVIILDFWVYEFTTFWRYCLFFVRTLLLRSFLIMIASITVTGFVWVVVAFVVVIVFTSRPTNRSATHGPNIKSNIRWAWLCRRDLNGLISSPNCDKCGEVELTEHFLYHCPAYIGATAKYLCACHIKYTSIWSLHSKLPEPNK